MSNALTPSPTARLGFRRMAGSDLAIIRPDNQPSRRVAEKIGLVLDRETVMNDLPVVVYGVDV